MKLDWKHIFNWDVVDVKAPQEVVEEGEVTGYKVVVTYKYHGIDEEFYSLEDERLYKVWSGPAFAARCSYNEHLKKMKRQALCRAR